MAMVVRTRRHGAPCTICRSTTRLGKTTVGEPSNKEVRRWPFFEPGSCAACAVRFARHVIENWEPGTADPHIEDAGWFLAGLRRYFRLREKGNTASHLRRGRKVAAEGFHTVEDKRRIRAAQGNRCAYCGATGLMHLDHKTPLARGGSNWPSNLQYLCAFHNLSKNSKTDAEYRALIGLPPPPPLPQAYLNIARLILTLVG